MPAERIETIIARVMSDVENGRETPSPLRVEPDSLWRKVVNDYLAAHSYVDRVKGKLLLVRVDSSSYLQELRMRKREIEKRLREVSGGRYCQVNFLL
ncbi:MAG TPA: DUF721 domain-containing protein [bacterium]|nr:DUF721 domain-containing protein [bacterium]HOL65919.1 DUF721 domain-containing protein [bacterium]HPP11951.1 DUF721 domain-containing protein [bacterium]